MSKVEDNLIIKFKRPCYRCLHIKPITDEILTLSGMGEPRFNMVVIRCEHDQVCGIYLDYKEEAEKKALVIEEYKKDKIYLICSNCGDRVYDIHCNKCGYKLIYPESGADSETR